MGKNSQLRKKCWGGRGELFKTISLDIIRLSKDKSGNRGSFQGLAFPQLRAHYPTFGMIWDYRRWDDHDVHSSTFGRIWNDLGWPALGWPWCPQPTTHYPTFETIWDDRRWDDHDEHSPTFGMIWIDRRWDDHDAHSPQLITQLHWHCALIDHLCTLHSLILRRGHVFLSTLFILTPPFSIQKKSREW